MINITISNYSDDESSDNYLDEIRSEEKRDLIEPSKDGHIGELIGMGPNSFEDQAAISSSLYSFVN